MHQVYIVHDINPHEFSMLKHGDKVKISKPPVQLVIVNTKHLNNTDIDAESANDSQTADAVKGANNTDNSAVKPDAPTTVNPSDDGDDVSSSPIVHHCKYIYIYMFICVVSTHVYIYVLYFMWISAIILN